MQHQGIDVAIDAGKHVDATCGRRPLLGVAMHQLRQR